MTKNPVKLLAAAVVASAALGLGVPGMPAQASPSIYMSVGVGAPMFHDYDDYLPLLREYRPRTRHVGEYYHSPRWRYRPRKVRVFKQVCERRVRVVRKWSYRKQRWVKRTWYGPRRCWRVRIR